MLDGLVTEEEGEGSMLLLFFFLCFILLLVFFSDSDGHARRLLPAPSHRRGEVGKSIARVGLDY